MKSSKMSKKVVIVGGGAAGMLASIVAARDGADVTVCEKNQKLGKKLAITGKGRCNLTNHCDRETLLANILQNPRFLYSAFSRFSPQDAMAFFEDLGVALKTERGARVFPVSDQAQEVVEALLREMKKCGVKLNHCTVKSLLIQDGRVTGVRTDKGEIEAEAVLIATGGLSYPACGATGDGYSMAEDVGHTITPLSASLVPLIAEPETCVKLQGLTLKNVVLSLYDAKKHCVFHELGEMLFTHFGVSGPLVLSASAHMRGAAQSAYTIRLDLKPGLDAARLDARLLRDFSERKNQDISNALRALLPAKLIPVVLARAQIAPDEKVHSIDKRARQRLIETVKGLSFTVQGKRPIAEAVITAGGIKTSEIDPKTMQSKRVSGLFFAGEMIDTDAYTGGFNLQIAWATAYVAGHAMAQREEYEHGE